MNNDEQSKPVAFTNANQLRDVDLYKKGITGRANYLYAYAAPTGSYNVPIYAHPPAQRQPLSDEQIDGAQEDIERSWQDNDHSAVTRDWFSAGVRFAERAHGIGAKP